MEKEVIPGGWVKLLRSSGDDLDIVNSARISFNKWHDQMEPGDDKLIDFLLRNRHGTPFEMVEFWFQVRAPITTIREWHRHRIASYNEISGRYIKMAPDSYVPAPEAVRVQKGKPGNYTFEPVQDANIEHGVVNIFDRVYSYCYNAYEDLLAMGVAKELARNVLNLGLFSEFRFKTNARSLMNFLSLRNAPNAMYEIRQYAEAMEEDFKAVLPVTYESFIKNGRVAP